MTTHKGSCLCGAVRFEVAGDLPPAEACHCTMCRKLSGHYPVWSDVPKDRLTISETDALRWYQSSEKVRRGFCGICGAPLFFDALRKDWTSVAMGAIDGPTQTHLDRHIFAADKGDYYEITDGLPQNAQ